LYYSPYISAVKSRRKKWMGHVTNMSRRDNLQSFGYKTSGKKSARKD
jgi:hypothetical protein